MDKKIKYNVQKKTGLSTSELETLLLKWKKKLLMNDWDIELNIVEFLRTDFRQSGDFTANPDTKKAKILMTYDPWRGDEEYTLVHEMLHILIYDFDLFTEKLVFKNKESDQDDHGEYLDKLEKMVHKITQIILGRPEPKG